MKKVTEILLVGGSAGSISVLLEVLPHLNGHLSFPIVVVVHRQSHPESILEGVLGSRSHLPVEEAYDKMTLKASYIYLVPADYHLLFENKQLVSLDYSEKINYSRPSIDVSFRSAAQIFTEHTTALLLSGANTDGIDGLRCIAQQRGTILVQDPDTAEIAYMPQQALLNLQVDTVLKPEEMASFINQLSTDY
ncbi:chemotaxis protein CheB [Sphingobacterium haloxyli]|uniref:protein-glutamate methylesterase n=1 Tax=Sphingobacterium haloxyli TaxID=2100533 RepID=A0A2S9J0Y2_9SPHI|nr:chemotaxis protein CheB [Sphingobacterium haloxyli]PRD46443.1 chemotaxis protein CheB [Sphingobacterium haloxyli]